MNVFWDGVHDGWVNMERDKEILLQAEEGIHQIRVYQWSAPWVSLGISQSRQSVLKPGCSIPTVMRPTGGRAVLHGHDLTIGLAKPLDEGQNRRALRAIYGGAIRPLIGALSLCGVRPAFGTDMGNHSISTDCFAHSSANDIVDEGTLQKLCGCALKVTDRAVLLQASIPIKAPLVDPAEIFPLSSTPHWLELDIQDFIEALDTSENFFAVK